VSRRQTRNADLPLLAWGDELRRRRLACRRALRRRAAAVVPIIGAVALSIVLPPRPRLVWNASASAPIGLYSVTLGVIVKRGDTVIAKMPATVRLLAASRRYIPADVPLVKHVGGVPGDTICAAGRTITINGRRVAIRLLSDGAGRPMPRWYGCHLMLPGELFLLSPDAPASFDGRYFGISPATDIIGTAKLLWAKPTQGSDDE
jgi:conjugative transfer signal peptidase TraF